MAITLSNFLTAKQAAEVARRSNEYLANLLERIAMAAAASSFEYRVDCADLAELNKLYGAVQALQSLGYQVAFGRDMAWCIKEDRLSAVVWWGPKTPWDVTGWGVACP